MLNSFLRLYLLFLIPCSLALGIGFYYSYSKQVEKTDSDFKSKYDTQTQIYADQILDIEHSYEVIMRNAILGIEQEDINLNTNVAVLKKLTKKYNISHLFLIDKSGTFKRSTNEDPKKIPNLFTFSNDYKALQTGQKEYLTTPIILPFPETEPHKFLTIWTGKYYIELGVRIKDIASKIKAILDRDQDILKANIEISSKPFTINSRKIKESHYKATQVIESQNPNYTQSDNKNKHYYSLDLIISKGNLLKEIEEVKSRHLTNFLLTIVLLTLVLFIATKYLSSKIQKLTNILNNLANKKSSNRGLKINTRSDDLNDLTSAINTFATKYGQHLAENEKITAINNIVSQVAHDIRSPLEALKTSRKELSKLPEDERLKINTAINRIEDIAYTLLKKKREDFSDRPADVQSSIEHILIEKRMQYRQYKDLNISLTKKADNFSIFARLDSTSLKNIISNIINNSAEAMSFKGEIQIAIERQQQEISIRISDNGTGFSTKYLMNPFNDGVTEKSTGNGIGLSQARKQLTAVNGSIEIFNDDGAVVLIKIPSIMSPIYSVRAISLYNLEKIIILDDDENIHNIWKSRFKDYDIKLESFSSGTDLIKKYQSISSNALLLSDYELINEEANGVDYIKKLKAEKSSILVTARSEEKELLAEVTKSKIKLLPKILATDVPILENKETTTVVLIDNDNLVHMNWKIQMKDKGLDLNAFYSIDEFLASSSSYQPDTHIFLDSDLGDGIKGEVDGIQIYDKGFNNIRITTGYTEIDQPEWVKSVITKCPQRTGLI